MLINEYNNHRDEHGESWGDKWFHNNSPSITISITRKGFGIPFKSEEDKKDFYLHKQYLRWLVGRPYKQPSFEEWKKLQLN